MDKFQGYYRIESSRLKNWNYSWSAYYFITICVKNRECYFGKIVNSKMALNDVGKIVESEWLKTPKIRPDMNLDLGEFVVMPNHFHAILFIGKNPYNSDLTIGRDAMHRVSTQEPTPNKFGSQSNNLSSIIRGFKSAVTMKSRKCNPDFEWQSRFHDRIIRDKNEWYVKTNYIKQNPMNWKDDEFYF